MSSQQKDGTTVVNLSSERSQKSDKSTDSFISVRTKTNVDHQRVEIERLQAELAGRDKELDKLRAENRKLRGLIPGAEPPEATVEPPEATGAAPATSDPSASPLSGQLPTIAEPPLATIADKQDRGGATRGSVVVEKDRSESLSQSSSSGPKSAAIEPAVKKPEARPSQGVRTEHAGRGVSSAAGQLAQAAYTDYESLLDDAFKAIKEIIACCKLMQERGIAKEEAGLVLEMGQASIYPLDQTRLLFRSAETGDEVDDEARQADDKAEQEARQAGQHQGGQHQVQLAKTKRTTVSLQHLTRSLQDAAQVTRKWSNNKMPMFGRTKFQAAMSVEMTKQANLIKAHAHAMLLEHGMRTSDFDKSKKALAQSYQLHAP